MREIKFRAWNRVSNQMWGCSTLEDISNFWEFTTKNLFLMQFTGLTDKNGVEIYEGDVVKGVEKDSGGFLGDVERIGLVDVYKGNTYYKIKTQHHQLLMYLYDCEVIGNIHENKDLIKIKI